MKKTLILIPLMLISLLLIFFYIYKTDNSPKYTKTIEFESAAVSAEVADTQPKITKGLMHRKSLGENEGMLFIFKDEKERNFWMKNTLIPLDMIFLNNDKKIVHIIRDAQPCEVEEYQLYNSRYPAMYVIEVNAGFTEEHNIQIGQKPRFS
jgi:hypothetical protein